eukprot:TRINITY_DN3508_c0_g1_i1.p1 TRINITY_DN3508_c0_g1~~TRINITY_DN3508_c0_g1_i1.p1  ORF type:complete len:232 (+),score=35.16 TRINITY_DN3508_c0_g1_i1:107-802(+)
MLSVANMSHMEASTRTVDPIVTGTSVLAIKYKGGVAIAADTLASYGSLARFRSVKRLAQVGANTIIGASGEYSDFQSVLDSLELLITSEEVLQDGSRLSPKEIHAWLTRITYNRRNKMDPLYNSFVLAGVKNGESFLGLVDMYGSSFEDDTIATGYGALIALPLMRNAFRPDLTKEEAAKILKDCMTVMYYRDARAHNRIQIGFIDSQGPSITEPFFLETNWDVGNWRGTI